uniref:Ninein-like n=1 Tax=Sander lucioperca TaxID=283035 RepID=A0A8C9XK14_SANLU
MEEAEHSRYVAQLKVEFDSCDTTATGFLDREELTVLCRKLQLDAQLPLLLDTLLGRTHLRTDVNDVFQVNFEEFKEGFVAVLSRSLDFSTSEDDSSYLEPVVPEEVKPKFVKGTKRYGRRSRPDSKPGATLTCDSEDSPPSRTDATDSSPDGVRRAKLRRSTSLESVESLKSDEEAGNQKENIQPDFQSKGTLCCLFWIYDLNLKFHSEDRLRGDIKIKKLDADLDGRVSLRDFQKVLRGSAPISCSTPVRSPIRSLKERSARSTSPSLLTAAAGQRVLSRLDDGSGCTSPERVISLWTEEGIRNSREILQTLDFPLEERVSLADLTLALDNEMLVSGNGIHQAALLSYKNEIQHLQVVAEQACRERDKVKSDLDQADQRNLQLVREVDDRHASMETLNQTMIRDLEQDFRDRLAALRSQSEQESEALLVQAERERRTLQDELQLLRASEAELQEDVKLCVQENGRLEEEGRVVKLKLTEAESSVSRLQRDLDALLHHKFGGLDPTAAGLSHEERFSEIVKDYELQCRELRDRNDELSSELELLTNQRSDRKSRRSKGDADATLSWSEQRPASTESDSDESEMKRISSPLVRKKLQPADKAALCSLDGVSGPAVSIQTELALETLKQKHNQELQQLHIKLETQVNYYERSLEVMRQSMEVERKDISQAFKMEISELEDQKAQAEQQVKQLKEKLQTQIQHGGGGGGGGGGWSNEQERRMQRERAELEQNFAREISNLVQRLSAEKEQLEAELKLKMDQDLMLVRTQLEEVRLENGALQERLTVLQQEVHNLEDEVANKRRKLEEMEQEHERSREDEERLHKENSRYREEVLDLSGRNLQLSNDNAELSARLRGDQESLRMLRERLATVSKEREEKGTTVSKVRQLQDAALQQEREKLQLQAVWTQERQLLERELSTFKEKVLHNDVVRADTALGLVQAQHARRLQELQRCAADGYREQTEQLHARLLEEQRKSQQLEEQLRLQNQQSSAHIGRKQDQYEKALSALQQRMEELETKLKGVRMVLQEKVQELKEQLARNRKSSALLKDLYVENSQLMKALQVTEQRQKHAEKKNFQLEDKVSALNKLLQEIVPASLIT